MIRFFKTGDQVPEWLFRVKGDCPMNGQPEMTFGAPAFVCKRSGGFLVWSILPKLFKGSPFWIDGEYQRVRIDGQGKGVHTETSLLRFIAGIFQALK